MPLSRNFSTITTHIHEYVRDNNQAKGIGVASRDVWYGDLEKIPRTPAITVFSGTKTSELGGNMERSDNLFNVFLIMYVGKVQDVQLNIKEVDQKAALLEELLNEDLQMGGLVTNGYVRAIDPGFAVRAGVLLRATRLTWQGYNRISLKAVS